jgi:hypothetical protein
MMMQGDPDHSLDYARSFGMFQGDPGRKNTRRGTITRGNTRSKRHSTKGTTSARPHGGIGGAVSDRVGGILDSLRSGNIQAAIGQGILGTGKHAAAGGRHRRSMNVANVKALRRGLRRVEGFEKLVKRIEKAYPRLKRAHPHAEHRTHHFGRKGK